MLANRPFLVVNLRALWRSTQAPLQSSIRSGCYDTLPISSKLTIFSVVIETFTKDFEFKTTLNVETKTKTIPNWTRVVSKPIPHADVMYLLNYK